MIEGKGGYSAIPDQSVAPVVAAFAVVIALQTVVSREISLFAPAVVTIGSFQAGDDVVEACVERIDKLRNTFVGDIDKSARPPNGVEEKK